jgi:hypothetical protein
MTPPDDNRPPWLDDALCRTNPVYVAREFAHHLEEAFSADQWYGTKSARDRMARQVRELAARGGRLPEFVVADFVRGGALPADFRLAEPERRPGVLGLAACPDSPLALVLPLRPRQGPWRVEPSLPFGPDDIQDGLVRLMHAAEMPTAGVIPERLGYDFENPLGRWVKGNSMTVAALLAVLDDLGKHESTTLRAACVLVELRTTGQLEAVARITDKLDAALRECGRLSLVVCHSDSAELNRYPSERLGEVWRVTSLSELARRLHQARDLAGLLKRAPLQRAEAQRVRDRVHWLVRQLHCYRDAADLGDRLRDCEQGARPEPGVWVEIARLCAEACRHHGRFTDAVVLSGRIRDEVAALGPLASDDEEADADAEYAAALFDNHQFCKVPTLLKRWADVAADAPRRLRPLTRVKVWNTLARGMVMLGCDGWEDLFRRSLHLNAALNDPENVDRTRSYLIHALLRNRDVVRAKAELEAVGARRDPETSPTPWDGFTLANIARCTGAIWEHPVLDRASVGSDGPRHAYGLYFQATARQAGRDDGDAAHRFKRAAEFMRAEAGDAKCNICILFALLLELAAAGRLGEGWVAAADAVRQFLDQSQAAPLREYYWPALEKLPTAPDPAAAEGLLCRVPYF